MTLLDAAGFAVLALHHRRLITTLLRVLDGRGSAEDHEAVPALESGETPLQWACRCSALADLARAGAADLARVTAQAREQLDRAARLGICAVALGDPAYPDLLTRIGDPPPVLWLRGPVDACSAPTIAVVGSRAATPYGLAMARRIATDLSAAGAVVISGLARGIDAAAHDAVIAANGRTVGVLGCGADRIYPPEHADLARRMQTTGAVVSEFPPGVPPLPHHFPLRNRIISGLSLGVVVVEAAEKSGALITASAAAEQGREVMVVPGPATAGRNRGGHMLIRDGATVVETAADILEQVGGQEPAKAPEVSPAVAMLGTDALDFTVDDVAARTGEPPGVVLSRLLDLELAGRIRRVGGGRFIRVLT
jgi:DNA processing protein